MWHRLFGVVPTLLLVGCFLLPQPIKAPLGTQEVDVDIGTGAGKSQDPDSAASQGPIFGIVHDESGKAAPNIKVTAFLTSNTPLIGNAGAGLAGNSGSSYRIASADARTDSKGRFVLSPPAAGSYNLEAVLSDESKSWKADVAFQGAGTKVDVGRLDLAPTGRISGRVALASGEAIDFSNTHVYIPGSGYTAITGSDGSYTLPFVPAGTFKLHAYHVDLGDADLPDAARPGLIPVRSQEPTEAPPLLLAFRIPELAAIFRSGTQEITDNGAAGTIVDIQGRYFAHDRRTRFKVLFGGVPADKPDRVSDTLITAKVPPGARNGIVSVEVGGLGSNQLGFRVIESLDLACDIPLLPPKATFDLVPLVTALDSKGDPVVAIPDGNPVRSGPNLDWSVNSNKAAVSRAGLFQAIAAGKVVLTAKAGDAIRTCNVTIEDGAPPPQTGQTENPALISIAPQNGGVGRELTITGDRLGFGAPLREIVFPGATASPKFVAASTLRVTIPAGARSGSVVLKVAGKASNALPFTVLGTVRPKAASVELRAGTTAALQVDAFDTEGTAVANPVLAWTSSAAAVADVDAKGTVTAKATGDAVVTAGSGQATASVGIHVFEIVSVAVNLTEITLNALPDTGSADATFVTRAVITASVESSDTTVRRVTWSLPANNGRVAMIVDAQNPNAVTVTTLKGASAGTVMLTATAIDDPQRQALVKINVTDHGALDVGVR
jgi:hypothetical protein